MAIVGVIEEYGEEKLIGVGRLVATADRDRASLALLVGDPWQHQGLGAQLADDCLEIADAWKIANVAAETTADNFEIREIL